MVRGPAGQLTECRAKARSWSVVAWYYYHGGAQRRFKAPKYATAVQREVWSIITSVVWCCAESAFHCFSCRVTARSVGLIDSPHWLKQCDIMAVMNGDINKWRFYSIPLVAIADKHRSETHASHYSVAIVYSPLIILTSPRSIIIFRFCIDRMPVDRRAYSKEFFGVHNFSGSSPPSPSP